VSDADPTREARVAVAHAHAAAEAEGDLETTMATLGAEPVYELQPLGRLLRGREAARTYYEHFFGTFQQQIDGYELRSEWVTDEGVGQEYVLFLKGPDGTRTSHAIVGILLFGDEGTLAGERLYASDQLFEVMVGPALALSEPIA